jgi:quercetin dioxygenase-like cupin family protein
VFRLWGDISIERKFWDKSGHWLDESDVCFWLNKLCDNLLSGVTDHMARAGDRMTAVETGETFIFVKTGADTQGRLLVIDMEVAPGGGAKAAPVHIHPHEEERFTITQGTMKVLLNGRESIHGVGDKIVIPAGDPHTWWNIGADELRFRLEFEAASKMEYLFESLCGLSQRGLIHENGQVSPLIMAIAITQYPGAMYIAGIPIWLQKGMFGVLAFIGRMVGYKSFYPYNTSQSAVRRQQQRLLHLL